MQGSEITPIPEGSLVTEAMLDAWCSFYGVADEESQRAGVLGSLLGFEKGQGELHAKLMNGNELFYSLMQSYWNATGNAGEMPEDWKKPLEKLSGDEAKEE